MLHHFPPGIHIFSSSQLSQHSLHNGPSPFDTVMEDFHEEAINSQYLFELPWNCTFQGTLQEMYFEAFLGFAIDQGGICFFTPAAKDRIVLIWRRFPCGIKIGANCASKLHRREKLCFLSLPLWETWWLMPRLAYTGSCLRRNNFETQLIRVFIDKIFFWSPFCEGISSNHFLASANGI